MVQFDGTVVPETEQEMELLEDLMAVTGDAFEEDDVSRESVVKLLQFSAMAIWEYGGRDMEFDDGSDDGDRRHYCPSCGERIRDVSALSIGGEVKIVPCGCNVEADEVRGWIGE